MKLRKILAASAATTVATTALATAANAALVPPETKDAGLSATGSMWLVQAFNTGNPDENKPATDYGVDYASIAQLTVTIKATDTDFLDGGIGGGLVFSCNGGEITQDNTDLWDKYNWPGCEYWGFVDEDLEIDTFDPNKPGVVEKVGAYTYAISNKALVNPLANGISSIGCMQVGIQYWGNDMSDYEVVSCELKDASGNIVLAFDGSGNVTSKAGSDAPADPAPEDPAEPAPEDPADPAPAPSNPGTGVEGIAVVAGVAVLATGAVIVSKKRK